MVLLFHVQLEIVNLPIIFFFYGLGFYSMGLAVLLEVRTRSELRIATILPLLGLFGIVHGAYEWLTMVSASHPTAGSLWFAILSIVVLGLSLVFLLFFGSELVGMVTGQKWVRLTPFLFIAAWVILVSLFFSQNLTIFVINGTILLHYLWYFPATVLVGIGFIVEYRRLRSKEVARYAYNFLAVAVLFILLGLVRILSVPKSFYFPASFFNEGSFLRFLIIPPELIRGFLAIAIAFFVIRGLRVFRAEVEQTLISLEEKKRILDVLQKRLLKKTFPKVKDLSVAAHYESATAAAAVGGDFYDFVELGNGRLAVAVGDVSGKGVEAASDAFLVTQSMRCLAFEYKYPKHIMSRINNIVYAESAGGFFITMAVLILELRANRLAYSNAGNYYPLICSSSGCQFLTEQGVVLGISSNEIYEQEELDFKKGDTLLLYTDGLVEARRDGEFFGEDRLLKLVSENKGLSTQRLVNLIVTKVKSFAKGVLGDDIVILAIKKVK